MKLILLASLFALSSAGYAAARGPAPEPPQAPECPEHLKHLVSLDARAGCPCGPHCPSGANCGDACPCAYRPLPRVKRNGAVGCPCGAACPSGGGCGEACPCAARPLPRASYRSIEPLVRPAPRPAARPISYVPFAGRKGREFVAHNPAPAPAVALRRLPQFNPPGLARMPVMGGMAGPPARPAMAFGGAPMTGGMRAGPGAGFMGAFGGGGMMGGCGPSG